MKSKQSLASLMRRFSLILAVLAFVGLFGLQVRPASAKSCAGSWYSQLAPNWE